MSAVDLIDRWWDWIVAASWQLAVLVVVVAVLLRCVPRASPRMRYGLWLLVLLKVCLPPTLTVPWSVGEWAIVPAARSLGLSAPIRQGAPPGGAYDSGQQWTRASHELPSRLAISPRTAAGCVWCCGVIGFLGLAIVQCVRLRRLMRAGTPVEEGPLRVALEEEAVHLGLRAAPELVVLSGIGSPFLIGVVRPCVVLPNDELYAPDARGLRSILAHELIHWQRRDTWIGWGQVLAQSLFWFHPFLWWANSQLRHERECVCDAEVLRKTSVTSSCYAESIVERLASACGRMPAFANVVGVLEHGSPLQYRLEEIMRFDKNRSSLSLLSRLVLVIFAALLLPMAPHSPAPTLLSGAEPADEAPPYPIVVSTSPANGDTDVDPGLEWVTVTFDRDMGRGMSWTGDIPMDKQRKAAWKDKRTCRLPVSLKRGEGYRIGINSKSFKNFKSASGEPTPPIAIVFVTKGAGDDVKRRVAVPKIVSLEPANGADDVDPALKQLQVTFDIPMGEGMSWTGGGDTFPTIPEGEEAKWSEDRRTCTLPVNLKPGHKYTLGINSIRFNNFQSGFGVPAEAVVYSFSTRD